MSAHIFSLCVCVAFVITEFLSFAQKIARKQMCHRWQHKDAYTEVNYVITNGKKRWIPHEKHTSEGATLANDGNRKLIKFQMDHLLLPPAASSQQFFASNFKWSIDLLVDSAAGVCYYFIRCKHSEIWSFLKRKSNRLVWPFCSMSSASLEASISSFDVILRHTMSHSVRQSQFNVTDCYL